jgi:hypothetical protein
MKFVLTHGVVLAMRGLCTRLQNDLLVLGQHGESFSASFLSNTLKNQWYCCGRKSHEYTFISLLIDVFLT